MVDDTELRHILNDPIALRIEPQHALACIRILQVPEAVPDQFADIKFIVEDTGPALRIAVDGRRPPIAALRARHALAVQHHCDRARRLAGKVVHEYPADDVGLGFIDRPLAAAGLSGRRVNQADDVVAVAEATTRFSIFHPAAEAAASLVGKILQVERAHRALETDMQLADFALGKRDDADAGKAHAFVEAGNVLLVARKTVQRLRQDEVESALETVGDQFLHAWPQQRRAGYRPVRIAVDDPPALALRAGTANPQLILDRGVALIVGGVTGVECDLHAAISLIREVVAGCALPFGFDEFARGVPRQQADEVAKARIGLFGIVGRHAFGWFENHPDAPSRAPFSFCHNAILVRKRVDPFLAKTGASALNCECEFPGILENSGA